ncbi:uncharacterized protein LOC110448037 [Mizuhopecten yessoensis]|uniref:Uncharacterized protein n=1 Tax=Mizuhopecten yessoensis TaxID=6573 RepID=A0A210QU31_MIZYE|nr:uncharacterized protein LOC110448037 [Mizuhopecten yessoensis]OWF52221.1 hypothetical protein KP79_PYT19363 [Mizuhopecten yessoensis]
MTEVLLPSLNIPGPSSLHPNVSTRTRQVDGLAFPFATSCAQAFRDRLPPVAARNKSAAKLRLHPGYSPNYWSYGTSYLVTLLFNGRLPNSFLKEVCHGPIKPIKKEKVEKKESVTKQPCTSTFHRKKELWEPKDHKKLKEDARRVEQRVMLARGRQRTRHDSISAKIHEFKAREENILLRKEEIMARGKRAFLSKLKSQAQNTCTPKPIQSCEMSVKDVPVKDVSESSCATEDGFVIVNIEGCELKSLEPLPDDSKSSE